jgi:hypothetical protein
MRERDADEPSVFDHVRALNGTSGAMRRRVRPGPVTNGHEG